jgi:predicted O-methyltransferase YrrM
MPGFVSPAIEAYLNRVTPHRDPALQEMEALAARQEFPIVGPLVGRLLYAITRALGARRVVELGSGFGYSAIWFARAVGEQGRVICIEGSPENGRLARQFLERAGVSGLVDWRLGDALEVLPCLEGPFDIVFNDIDKADYPKVLEPARRALRPGGMLISDNLLWFGKVAEPDPDASTRGVQEFTKALYAAPDFFTTILPLRDGVGLSLKSANGETAT